MATAPVSLIPTVRQLSTTEVDTLYNNLIEQGRFLESPSIIAVRTARRGTRRAGEAVNSPRRKPLFLHMLLLTHRWPGFTPSRVWLNDIQLSLEEGWATNPELCEGAVNLVYCEAFPTSIPPAIMSRCFGLGQIRSGPTEGLQSVLYLRLEWRKQVFPGIPTFRVAA